MNYFKAAEQLLSSVPTLRKSLSNLNERRQHIIESGRPQDADIIDTTRPFVTSRAANEALDELLELSECSRNIGYTEQKLKEIESVLLQMESEHSKVARLWYIDKLSKEKIMEQINVDSLTTVYKLRNAAVAEFALLYYGAAAIPSI